MQTTTAGAMGASNAGAEGSSGSEGADTSTDTGVNTGESGEGGENEQSLQGSQGMKTGEKKTVPVTRINPTKKAPPEAKKSNPVLDQMQELLSKNGGLTVTANGKAHKIDTAKDLERFLQRGIPADRVIEETTKARQEAAKVQQLFTALTKGDAKTKAQLLERILTPEGLDELSMARAKARFEREEEHAKLTPREREYQERIQKLEPQAQLFAKFQQMMAQKQEEAESRQHVERYRVKFDTALSGALDILQIPKEARKTTTRALAIMRPYIEKLEDAGMDLDPQFLADKVREELSESVGFFTNNLEGEALLKFLGEGVGKKVRKAILAQLQGGTQSPAPVVQKSGSETRVATKKQESENGTWPSKPWFG